MAAQVGALRVTLGANTAQFEAGMRQAQASARRTGQDISTSMARAQQSTTGAVTGMRQAVSGLAATIGTLGISLGVGAVISAGQSILQFADDLEAAAEQAGMSVERYQTLREALRTLEIDGQMVDRAFRQLQTTLGDVQNGVDNAATQSLDRLGIKARILNGEITTSDQLLDALAASAETAGSAAQFTSEIVDIFGQRVGPQLAAALRDGGVALHELEQAMRDSGTVIDEEVIQRFAEANETVDRFFESTRRQAVIWAAEMIDAFQAAGAAILDFSNLLPQGMRLTSLGAAASALMGVPGGRAVVNAMEQNAQFVGSALAQLNTGGARRPPRSRASGGGGGGGRRRSGGRGPSRSSTATRGELYDMPIAYQGPTFAEQERELEQLNRQLVNTEEVFDRITASIPDVTGLMRLQEAQAFMDDFAADLSSGLADAIIQGRNLGDVLVQSFQRAAAALIESQLYDLLTGGRSGGGALGFISGIFGGSTGINGGSFGGVKGGMSGAASFLAGLDSGGTITVGGNPGVDQNLLSLNGVPVARVSKGETVGVGRGGGRQKVEVVVSTSPLLTAMIAAGDAAAASEGSFHAQSSLTRRAARRIP